MLDTLSNVKSRLGITGTAYDSFLTQQIQLVSDAIERYCNRSFVTASYKQTFYCEDNSPAVKLTLFHFPVQSITSILVDGVVLDPTNYRLHLPTGIVTGLNGTIFFIGKVMEITYVAGYDAGDVPTPIISVLDAVVTERYNKHSAGVDLNFGSDVQRISIPGAISIDFDYSLNNNQRGAAYGVILGSNVNVLDDWSSERSVIGRDKLEYVEVL